MKKEFSDYLRAIGIADLFYDRVVEIYQRLSDLLEEDIVDIFVSDYAQNDGTRVYENLRLFAEGSIVEVDQFLTSDNIFFNDIKKCPVIGWRLHSRDYDYKQATTKSRMSLEVSLSGLYVEFKATQENCDHLYALLKKHFVPNAQKPSPLQAVKSVRIRPISQEASCS
jgi:hypothetical protein